MIPRQPKPETFEERRARLDAMFNRSYPARPRTQVSKPVDPVPGSVWTVEPWDLDEAVALRRGGVALRYLSWRYGLDPQVIEQRLKAANPKG